MDPIGESSSQNLEGFSFLMGTNLILGLILIILMTVWTRNFRGGFAWTSNPKLQFNWHPFLMTIGLVFLYANGMLIYRSQRLVRKKRLKLIHMGILIFVLLLTVIGLVAVFDMHNMSQPPIPNMYSLHSWVGLTSVILFACQWLSGFLSFLYPVIEAPLRSAYLPIHAYFGTAGFVGAIASCLLGLNEKAFFVLKDYSELKSEAVLINIMGLIFVLFGGLTVYLVSQPRYKRESTPEDEVLLTGRPQ